MGEMLVSLAQLLVALALSVVTVYAAFYVVQWLTRGVDEWAALRQGNAAIGIVLGAILIAVAIVLRPALAVDTTTWDLGSSRWLAMLLAEAVQVVLGLIVTAITLLVALTLFSALTRGVDEIQELKNGNLAVAGLLAGVVIGVGLLVSQAVAQIMTLVASALF